MATSNEFQFPNSPGFQVTNAAYTLLSQAVPIPCVGATWVRIGAVCDTSGATLAGVYVFFDSVGYIVGTSPLVAWTSSTPAYGTPIGPYPANYDYLGEPSPEASIQLCGAFSVGFFVNQVSAGNWNIRGRLYFPNSVQ